jgi:hypothetical protein
MTGTEFAPATMPAPIPLPPVAEATPPAPAVVADTTPIVSGVEIPPPASSLMVPPVTYPVSAPAPAAQVPVASPLANIPTWAWVLGGAALLGLLGFIAWTVTRPAITPSSSRVNPLMRGEGTRRRFRRVRRAKRRSR